MLASNRAHALGGCWMVAVQQATMQAVWPQAVKLQAVDMLVLSQQITVQAVWLEHPEGCAEQQQGVS